MNNGEGFADDELSDLRVRMYLGVPNIVHRFRSRNRLAACVSKILQRLATAPFPNGDRANFSGRSCEVEDKLIRVLPTFDGANGSNMSNCLDGSDAISSYVLNLRSDRAVDFHSVPTVLPQKCLLKSLFACRNNHRVNNAGVHSMLARLHHRHLPQLLPPHGLRATEDQS